MTSRSLRLGNSRLKLEGRNWLLQMVKDVEIAVRIGVHFQKVNAPHHQLGRVRQRLQAMQGHQIQLQSHHNSSLLFGAKQPKPQLEMHFSKSAVFFMCLIWLEFFFGFAWLEAVENRICCRSNIFYKKHC